MTINGLCDSPWTMIANGEYILGRKFKSRFVFGKYYLRLLHNRDRGMFIAQLGHMVKLCKIFC